MSSLIFLLFLSHAFSQCIDIPNNYQATLPEDNKEHTNQTYDYYWKMGVLFANGRTFGYLVGLDSCRIHCTPDEDDLLLTASFVDQKTNSFLYNTVSWEHRQNDVYIKANPYTVHAGNFKLNTVSDTMFNLKGELPGVKLDLMLLNTKNYTNIYEKVGNKIQGIHNIRPELYTIGIIEFQGEKFNVTGLSFMDHYWNNINCSITGHEKWKWFFLQLSNRFQLMLLEINQVKQLFLIHPNNSVTFHQDFQLIPTHFWTSVRSGIKYPIKHTLIFEHAFLYIDTLVDNNEFFFLQKPLISEAPSLVMGEFFGMRVSGTGTTEVFGH